jgi:hypothetical protein
MNRLMHKNNIVNAINGIQRPHLLRKRKL